MKTGRLHILVALAAILTLFASCRKDEAEVIPRKTLAKIYAEMLVTDQWITSTPGVRRMADTSLVYEPILEKYGYDSEDYRVSMDKYMDDPERFSRILRTTAEILDGRIEKLSKEQTRLLKLAMLPKIYVEFNMGELSSYFTGEPYVHYFDSLDVVLDSSTLLYNLVSIERGDTLYEGLRMVIKDSLEVSDSIAADLDSLRPDLLKIDLIRRDSTKIRQKQIKHPNGLLNKKSLKIDSLKKVKR